MSKKEDQYIGKLCCDKENKTRTFIPLGIIQPDYSLDRDSMSYVIKYTDANEYSSISPYQIMIVEGVK